MLYEQSCDTSSISAGVENRYMALYVHRLVSFHLRPVT